jgi:hypothetical protein|tara:strand:+ start:82 stop:423 length:342 start_codon:yes stop_codon:yes gene_type:complete
MKNKSRQQKARYLQNIVKAKIIKLFELNPEDIRTSNTGEGGEDIKLLSLTSKKVFPYSTECKNSQQHLTLYKNFRQANRHNRREPLLIVKMNRERPLAIIDLDHFFSLIERDE